MREYTESERFKYIYINGEKTHFMISSLGRLFSLDYNKSGNIQIILPFLNEDGHLEVALKHNEKNYCKKFHRLVAEAFIPNPENKPEIHHVNGDHLDNRVDNLMWVTRKEHAELTAELHQYDVRRGEDNPLTKYSDAQIEHVCQLIVENKRTLKEISKITGVSYANIQLIMHHKNTRVDVQSKYDLTKFDKYFKYSKDQIHNVCKLLTKKKFNDQEIADKTGVAYSTVKAIRLRKRWTIISQEYEF